MRKQRPKVEKMLRNEEHAARFGVKKKKGQRRKERHARVLVRETAALIALGVDPTESEAPVA